MRKKLLVTMSDILSDKVRWYCFLHGMTVSAGIALFTEEFLKHKVADMANALEKKKNLL